MRYFIMMLALLVPLLAAAEEVDAQALQEFMSGAGAGFQWIVLGSGRAAKYQAYLQPESQSLLPLPPIDKAAWKNIVERRPLRVVYREPGKYYNNKVYTFTLYQATDDGAYYLDAKGGFWGMDELAYGPLTVEQLQ